MEAGPGTFPDFLEMPFNEDNFFWAYITPQDIRRAITGLRSNSIGSDGLSPKFIKMVASHDVSVFEYLFNCSLDQRIFPQMWKSALVCPIPKVAQPAALEHYRPIAILPTLSKLLERIVCNQIQHYMETNNRFDPCQFAYRRGHSTQTCIVRMLDDVRKVADCRMITISVLFDFSKTFDRVDHVLLIRKLKSLGFSTSVLRWIWSYITDRYQSVKDPVTGELSGQLEVGVGVPQGSVIGPLLFILYITDVQGVLRDYKYNFYADDLQIYLHCYPWDIIAAIQRINLDIERLVDWTRSNKLILNTAKTQSIIFGTARYLNSLDLGTIPKIAVSDVLVQYSEQVKYLRVILTPTLSWDANVTRTVGMVHRILYQLKLCRRLLSADLRRRLVTSLVLPLIDYCSVAQTDITFLCNQRLQRALNAGVRFIFDLRTDEHITPYFEQLDWLRVDKRRQYLVRCLLYKVLRTERSSSLHCNFTFRVAISGRETRAADDTLSLPLCRTEWYKRSFTYTASDNWNSLPINIRNASTSANFCCGFRDLLLRGE